MFESSTKDNNYQLMNRTDIISENWNRRPWVTYVALDEHMYIVAAGNYLTLYNKAVSRGCKTPYIENAVKILNLEKVKEHNNLLEKALLAKETVRNP